MSATHYDLGARLRAAASGRPVRTATFAPCLPLNAPIAVDISTRDGVTQVTAHDGTSTMTAAASDAMRMLSDLNVGPQQTYRTIVAADRHALSHLAQVARTDHDSPAAAVVAWWDQRADHPGSCAVHLVVPTARRRWTLGVVPERDNDLETWRTWLNVEAPSAAGLLAMARLNTSGPVLPGLLDVAGADTRSWEALLRRLESGWDWRLPDGRRDAALGLATRQHATELFESLRLCDPAVARREQYTGRLVTGTVTDNDPDHLVLRADRPVCRLRVGTQVAGWVGEVDGEIGAEHLLRTARVDDVHLDTSATLTLTLTETISRPRQLPLGARITLRPAHASPALQSTARRNMAIRYRAGGNWIAGRGIPVIRRSDVPLDVVLAAAPPE